MAAWNAQDVFVRGSVQGISPKDFARLRRQGRKLRDLARQVERLKAESKEQSVPALPLHQAARGKNPYDFALLRAARSLRHYEAKRFLPKSGWKRALMRVWDITSFAFAAPRNLVTKGIYLTEGGSARMHKAKGLWRQKHFFQAVVCESLYFGGGLMAALGPIGALFGVYGMIPGGIVAMCGVTLAEAGLLLKEFLVYRFGQKRGWDTFEVSALEYSKKEWGRGLVWFGNFCVSTVLTGLSFFGVPTMAASAVRGAAAMLAQWGFERLADRLLSGWFRRNARAQAQHTEHVKNLMDIKGAQKIAVQSVYPIRTLAGLAKPLKVSKAQMRKMAAAA